MVCFCDIPLSQLMSHIDTYGNYGLGMTKEWGIRKGLNPVIYFSKNSNLAKKLSILTNKSVWQNDENSRAFHEVMLYFKPYEGTLYRGGKTKQRVRFYDEHEWRYTPNRSNMAIKNIKMSVQKHVYRDAIQLANENQKLETDFTRLDFTADDIKYVIIKTEDEINGMIEALTRIKGNRYDRDTLNRLTSRIITVEQIQEDF